ncbi:MAG: hypothetical protein JWM41_2705 [Gemmatimonadetes bacterium]|nr:hypothetical protein [Gemmatimonadota bacterium]
MASSPRIDELRKKFDENPRRYFAPLANEYRKAGDLEQAVFICQEYLPQQPGHMSGHIVYGQTLFEMGRQEEAQVVFETALSLDPENLIALRHLGDIARLSGDSNAARVWYQRVLEADPRNEEIAQLMISLLAAPEPSAAPTINKPNKPSEATPLSMPAIPRAETPAPAAQEASAARGSSDASEGGFVVEKSEDDTDLRAATPFDPAPPVEPPPPAHAASETKAGDGQDFLSLEDFNLGGVPLSSVAPSAAPESESSDLLDQGVEERFEELSIADAFRIPTTDSYDESAPAPEAKSPLLEEAGFELGNEDGPFEADPFAIAGSSGEPSIELAVEPAFEPSIEPAFEPLIESATDINLGLVSADSSSDAPTVSSDAPFIDGLESFEPDAIASATADVPAFVTETMAELYLSQGHLDAALDIYRQLVEQRPGDAGLEERLRAVEDRVYANAAPAADEGAAPAPVYGGPTIREFLLGLASRRTPLAVDAVPEADYMPAFEDEGAFAAAPDAPPASEASEPSAASEPQRYAPADETVRGSIDALFTGADASAPSSSDASAANTLQEAFAPEGPDTAPLQGMPAHRASSELQLDHVFKGNSPPRADGDGFSFDQFFAEEMAEGAPSATSEGSGAPTEVTDDIAQFNAWLNGLKKT